MKKRAAIIIAGLAFASPAVASEVQERAFMASHSYLTGAMICADYVGTDHLSAAETLVRRFWEAEGMSGSKLEAAMVLSLQKAHEGIGGRTLPSEMPGWATNADQALACTQQLAKDQIAAQAAVIAHEGD